MLEIWGGVILTSDDIVTVELRVGIIFLTSDDIVIVEWRGGEWKEGRAALKWYHWCLIN